MKALFLLIVIANVGLLMWEYHQGVFEPTIEAPLVNKEPILLVSELKKADANEQTKIESLEKSETIESATGEQQRAPEIATNEQLLPAANTEATEVQASTAPVCYEAGPFADIKVYNSWYSLLTEDNKAKIKPFERDEPTISSYMVFYPAEKNLEQSEKMLEMLKEQGIKDLLLQRAGKDQGEISLGVFNSEARALVLKKQLQGKGITVEIKPRYKPKMKKFVQFFDQASVLESLQKIQTRDKEFTIKPLETCP